MRTMGRVPCGGVQPADFSPRLRSELRRFHIIVFWRVRMTLWREVSMRRVRYAVVMSLDGYSAGPKGEVDWMVGDPAVNLAKSFEAFYAQFDIAVMGRRTYEL